MKQISALNYFSLKVMIFTGVLFGLVGINANADVLDDGIAGDKFLSAIAEQLTAYQIDVTSNLNDRDVLKKRIQNPRLGRFPDLPANSLPNSIEINAWETEYTQLQIGGVAILANASAEDLKDSSLFLHKWLESLDEDRIFTTFYLNDLPAAEKIASIASASGYTAYLFADGLDQSIVGNLFATAARRLAIDTRAARRYRSEVNEIDYLGQRVRRKTNSLFRDKGNSTLARREPSVFLKETLGDEFNQSTISEVIVPGGVALGASASLTITPLSLNYTDGAMHIVDETNRQWDLPELDIQSLKALFDFVERSILIKSDAIVDIDADARVRISSALRNTDAGYAIMHADTQPFEFVPNLPVTKSVVIDTDVHWLSSKNSDTLKFTTDYEVRFLSADIMRIAQTRVALEYEYESETETANYRDAWGRDIRRLDDNLDYAGLGQSMEKVASYAGWIGLLRKLKEDNIPFLHGRYEFMKIDKSGRKTPARH